MIFTREQQYYHKNYEYFSVEKLIEDISSQLKGLSIKYDPKTQSVTLTTQGTVYIYLKEWKSLI